MKTHPILFSEPMIQVLLASNGFLTFLVPGEIKEGEPGDFLWVKESIGFIDHDPITAADASLHFYDADTPENKSCPSPYYAQWIIDDRLPNREIPAADMPRWASRLTLKIVDNRTLEVIKQNIDELI